MIEVHRPKSPPKVLRDQGKPARDKHCRDYTRSPREYDRGEKLFQFDRAIYGHADVKAALRQAQHGKCAFCESHITHIAYGDVEHFRPKGGVCQRVNSPLERPGYYWLAYTWENLLFVCQICNQRHKKSHFPLANWAERARRHTDDLTVEQPLFLDPAAEDPALSLSFRAEVPFSKNRRGRETIRALGLTRAPLREKRKERLDLLRAAFVVAFALSPTEAALIPHEVRDARALLHRAVSDQGEYAAMVRAAIPRWEREFGVRMT